MTHLPHLPFADPARVKGTEEVKLAEVSAVRDVIWGVVQEVIDWGCTWDKKKRGNFPETKDIKKVQLH